MKVRIVDEKINLIPFYKNEMVAIDWYQDLDLVKQVDNVEEPYTIEKLNRMYSYLDTHGDCFYIEYEKILVGDITLCDDGEISIVICRDYQNKHIGRKCVFDMIELAKEKGFNRVYAKIYSFNAQSQKMFQRVGFKKEDNELYVFRLKK